MTKEEKLECKEIAREIIAEVLKGHIETCPHGVTLLKSRFFLIGICAGMFVQGTGIALIAIKMLLG